MDMRLIDKVCEILDTTQCEFPRINVVMTLELCANEAEREDLNAMIDTLGYQKATVPMLHDLSGFNLRHARLPGYDCWVPQSSGYAAAAQEHANRV